MRKRSEPMIEVGGQKFIVLDRDKYLAYLLFIGTTRTPEEDERLREQLIRKGEEVGVMAVNGKGGARIGAGKPKTLPEGATSSIGRLTPAEKAELRELLRRIRTADRIITIVERCYGQPRP